MPITDTVRAILAAATEHPNHLASAPERLPVAAKRVVIQSMVKAGLVEQVQADDDQPAWRTGDDGVRYALRATDAGLHAVRAAVEDEPAAREPNPAVAGHVPAAAMRPAPARLSAKIAAHAVLTAWDDPTEGRPALPDAIEALRAALSGRRGSSRPAAAPRQPRPDTKRATVLVLLRRPAGATVAQVVEATGWARHTVHGFFAGLKTQGIPVEVLDRVRQVGPGNQGATGSYTVYRVAEAV